MLHPREAFLYRVQSCRHRPFFAILPGPGIESSKMVGDHFPGIGFSHFHDRAFVFFHRLVIGNASGDSPCFPCVALLIGIKSILAVVGFHRP